MSNKNRKVFYHNQDDTKPVYAAGVIFYRIVKSELELLLITHNNKYEDIGGKIEQEDQDIIGTIHREVLEETNGIIDMTNIEIDDKMSVYMVDSKYVVHIIKAPTDIQCLDKTDFGNLEIHSDIVRSIEWIKLKSLTPTAIKHKLHFRLKSKELFAKLRTIDIEKKYSKKLF